MLETVTELHPARVNFLIPVLSRYHAQEEEEEAEAASGGGPGETDRKRGANTSHEV